VVDYQELKSLVDLAVDYASEKVEGIIARGTIRRGSQIRFSQSQIDIAKRWEELNLEMFIIYEGAKAGFTERSTTSPEDVKSAVDETISFLRVLPESMFFAGVEDRTFQYNKIEGRYDSKIDGFTDRAPEIVNASIQAALDEGAKRVAGALKFSKEMAYVRSSYGPTGETKETSFDLNVRAFQEELDYSGQGLSCGTEPTKSEREMIDAGARAGRLSKQAVGTVQGEPGVYDVVLSPTVAANVIAHIPATANPFMVLIGLSALGDRMGEQIGPEWLSVWDDPTLPGGVGSRAFDFEGTPSRRVTIVENGVLKAFVHNTTTARMYETESTGSSVPMQLVQGMKMLLPDNSNIVFSNGDHSLEELLEGSRPTIYVTCNWYTRFQNYQTGEFSTIPRDAMFLVNNGEMTPIKNIRISDNVMRMFSNIDAMGNDRTQILWWEVPTPTFVPSIRVRNCRITAATQ